jgi:hypothetical protein
MKNKKRVIELKKGKKIDEITLLMDGWIFCGMKYFDKKTYVIFERIK